MFRIILTLQTHVKQLKSQGVSKTSQGKCPISSDLPFSTILGIQKIKRRLFSKIYTRISFKSQKMVFNSFGQDILNIFILYKKFDFIYYADILVELPPTLLLFISPKNSYDLYTFNLSMFMLRISSMITSSLDFSSHFKICSSSSKKKVLIINRDLKRGTILVQYQTKNPFLDFR